MNKKFEECFEISEKNKCLKIKFPEEFRGLVWSTHFGRVQKSISDTKMSILNIDMSHCTWADPTPMLSLLISLRLFKNDKTSINFYIPRRTEKHNAFLAFLYQEGFIQQLKDMDIKIIYADLLINLSVEDLIDIGALEQLSNYKDCCVLPARIKDLTDLDSTESVEEYISNLMDEIDNVVCNKVPNYAADAMCMKLYNILLETIDNVCWHAYPSNKNRFVGVYIRYRNGLNLPNSLNEMQQKRVSERSIVEEIYYPKLSSEMINNSEGFFEVFVMDSGIGLKGTVKVKRADKELALRSCFQEAFFNGYRNKSSNKPTMTAYGGLELIHKMLEVENDFIHAHEKFEWIGLPSYAKQTEINDYKIKDADKLYDSVGHVKGLSWVFRLSWKKDAARNQRNVFFSKEAPNKHPVYLAFLTNSSITQEERNATFYIDQRDNWRDDNWHGNKLAKNKDLMFSDFYWLPDEMKSKNDIILSLQRYTLILEFCTYMSFSKISEVFFSKLRSFNFYKWFSSEFKVKKPNIEYARAIIDNESDKRILSFAVKEIRQLFDLENNVNPLINDEKRTLIILDIPSYELIIYKNSLEHIPLIKLQGFSNLFDSLIICSRHYEIIAFSKSENNKTLEINDSLAEEFVKGVNPRINMARSALWLRYHDSVRFWKTLITDQEKSLYYTNAYIKWGQTSPIKGYLHFDNIMGHPKLFNYIKLAIDRTIGYFPNKNAIFSATDIFVRQIVEECNIVNNATFEMGSIINVSSVFASGLTISLTSQLGESENLLRISVFCHPDMEKLKNDPEDNEDVFESSFSGDNKNIHEVVERVLLWPKSNSELIKPIPVDEDTYKRIGYTPFIEDENEDYHIIDRNAYSGVYERNVIDTYKDIQMRGFNTIQIGHREYLGAHNFFNYNYYSIIENSKRSGKGVFPFLFKALFFSLCEEYNDEYIDRMINGMRDDHWKEVIRENKKDNKEWNRVSVIICPSHHYTSLLIRDITACLPEDFAERFILVDTLVYRKNGIIIPPSSIKLIKEKLRSFSHIAKDVLIFDNFIESGRTRKIIKNILLSNPISQETSIEKIKTLTIVDSYRLPYSEPHASKHRSYWRFDIPRLGNNQACSLCSSLAKAKEMINEIKARGTDAYYRFMCNEEISKRIEEWIKNWSCISSLNRVAGHGIDEVVIMSSIDTDKIDSKFAPVIKTNVGLAVYSAEMQSIHLKDNIILDIISALEADENNDQIALVISSNLLLYGKPTSQTFHIKLLCKLLYATSKIKQRNNYSSLSALTLLAQDEKCLEQAILSCLNDKKQKDIFGNDDLNIVFSYLSQKYESLQSTLPVNISLLIKHNFNSKQEPFRRFHFELYNDNGISHMNPLEELNNNGFRNNDENSILLLNRVRSSLETIMECLSNIDKTFFAEYVSTRKSGCVEKFINEIKTFSGEILDYLRDVETSVNVDDIGRDAPKILKKSRDIYTELEKIHERLFMALGKKQKSNTLMEKIETIIGSHKLNSSYIISMQDASKKESLPDSGPNELWYYWNPYIANELKDLFNNVCHCSSMIKTESGSEAHMLVSVKTELDYYTITMKNETNDNWDVVREKMSIKDGYRTYRLRNEEFGIITVGNTVLKENDTPKYTLTVEMKIPEVKYRRGKHYNGQA